jgi:hypothetical protein
MRWAAFPCCLVALLAIADVGCSSEGEAAHSSHAAFTVDHGDQFVVSATSDHVVLKKKVDDVDFPFDESSLADKAILIHPVVDRAKEGVYSRVTNVTVDGDTYVLDARPLTLAEMAKMTEDDIVRIYMDVRSAPRTDLPSDTLKPSTMTFHPLAFSANGVAFNGFNLTGFDFGSPIAARAGVSFTQTIETATLNPEVLADYSSDDGLALGFRGEMAWKSHIEMSGRVSGEFFHSAELEGPPLPIYVPIGPVPVPATLKGKAFVSCAAGVTGLLKATVDIDLAASISASMQVNPNTNTDMDKWVTQGPWPSQASGHATVTPQLDDTMDPNLTVTCAVPRVEVHADIAGIAGPYIAISPSYVVTTNPTGTSGFMTRLAAGMSAGALGFNTGVEVLLYTWTP